MLIIRRRSTGRLLDYTYHINRTIFQNCNIDENIINNYGLEFILTNTSNEYDLGPGADERRARAGLHPGP